MTPKQPERQVFATFTCLIMLAIPGYAAPITFTLSGTGSGVAGATSFTDSPFTIRLFADTTNVVQVPPDPFTHNTVFSVNGFSSSIDIGGIGAGTFLIPTLFSVNQNSNSVGIASNGADPGDLLIFEDLGLAALATYDLRTSLGPLSLTDSGELIFQGWPVSTTIGPVYFTARPENMTFTALAVPEPSSVGLFALALLSLMVWRSSKGKKAVTTPIVKIPPLPVASFFNRARVAAIVPPQAVGYCFQLPGLFVGRGFGSRFLTRRWWR